MGRLYNAAGTEMTDANMTTAAGAGVAGPAIHTVASDVYEDFVFPGTASKFAGGPAGSKGRRLKFHAGQKITAAQLAEAVAGNNAALTSASPATGPAAGGTVVTVTGTNLTGTTSLTFGGTAGTAFSVLSDTQVRATTPAKTAGAYNVVAVHPNGNGTLTNGFTYV